LRVDVSRATAPFVIGDAPAEDRAGVAAILLRDLGLVMRPGDAWESDAVTLVERAATDLLIAARWSPAAFLGAIGGPITLIREREHPIVTDAAGVRYPLLGLYDSQRRTLTINNWSFDARTGGEAAGRRVFLHELAHAWDGRSRYLLSWGMRWLPGARASDYARTSRFEDWADAVMGAVYGAEPGHGAFDRDGRGRPAPRLRYVRAAFARYRRGARA
jgi:hypothetical protein